VSHNFLFYYLLFSLGRIEKFGVENNSCHCTTPDKPAWRGSLVKNEQVKYVSYRQNKE
jgi:hypothetical protein